MNGTNITSTEWNFLTLFVVITRPVLCVFAFLGNLLTLVVIYRVRRLRTINNVTITSLAVADMLVGLSGCIIYVLVKVKAENIPTSPIITYFIRFFTELYGVCIYTSFVHLVVLSIERSVAIFLPLRYTTIIDKTCLKTILSIAWIMASVLSIIANMKTNRSKNVKYFLIFVMVISYMLYLFIVLSLLLMAIKTVMLVRQKRRILPGQKERLNFRNGINKATKRISLILIVFIITYTPSCFSMLVYLNVKEYECIQRYVIPFFNNVITINSCLNIVIYSTTSLKFRSAYSQQIKCLFQRMRKPLGN